MFWVQKTCVDRIISTNTAAGQKVSEQEVDRSSQEDPGWGIRDRGWFRLGLEGALPEGEREQVKQKPLSHGKTGNTRKVLGVT